MCVCVCVCVLCVCVCVYLLRACVLQGTLAQLCLLLEETVGGYMDCTQLCTQSSGLNNRQYHRDNNHNNMTPSLIIVLLLLTE